MPRRPGTTDVSFKNNFFKHLYYIHKNINVCTAKLAEKRSCLRCFGNLAYEYLILIQYHIIIFIIITKAYYNNIHSVQNPSNCLDGLITRRIYGRSPLYIIIILPWKRSTIENSKLISTMASV